MENANIFCSTEHKGAGGMWAWRRPEAARASGLQGPAARHPLAARGSPRTGVPQHAAGRPPRTTQAPERHTPRRTHTRTEAHTVRGRAHATRPEAAQRPSSASTCMHTHTYTPAHMHTCAHTHTHTLHLTERDTLSNTNTQLNTHGNAETESHPATPQPAPETPEAPTLQQTYAHSSATGRQGAHSPWKSHTHKSS